MSESTIERGFQYDRLTVADDGSFEATRDNIFACPCGEGPWVSVQTGRVYRGNGGSERDQWALQASGPWVRIIDDTDLADAMQRTNEAQREVEKIRKRVAEAIGVEL